MAFTINTNIASLQAQEYLRVTGDFQAKTINRVTSGLRIINAGDDAAGLAIANSFRSDQAVLSQGIRNANDGLATLQTIDGGLSNISKLLDRARSLAAQSASGLFSGDRGVLNTEFQNVLEEIDRQAQAIGMNVGGKFAKNLSVFIGGGRTAAGESTGSEAITNGSVAVDLTSSTVDTKSLGLMGYTVTGAAGLDNATTFATAKGAATSMTLTLAGGGFSDSNAISVTVNLNGVNDLSGLVDAINAGIETASQGVTAAASAFRDAGIRAAISGDGTSFTLQSTSGAFSVYDGNSAVSRAFLGTTAGDQYKVGGGLESYLFDWNTALAAGETQLVTISTVDESGNMHTVDITIGDAGGDSVADAVAKINTALQNTNDAYLKSMVASLDGSGADHVSISSTRNFSVTVGAEASGHGLEVSGGGQSSTVTASEVAGGSSVTIASQSAAQNAVTVLADAVVRLGSAQAVVGKGENQFNFAVSLASTQLTNLAASESRIRDADLAYEAANLTKAQILQQAGIAALAQANAAPQAVLSLLRG